MVYCAATGSQYQVYVKLCLAKLFKKNRAKQPREGGGGEGGGRREKTPHAL
jgi:hypothetical protein